MDDIQQLDRLHTRRPPQQGRFRLGRFQWEQGLHRYVSHLAHRYYVVYLLLYRTGRKINEQAHHDLVYHNDSDQFGYAYPEDGLLQIFDAKPESEIRQPTQRYASGDPAMRVLKNGVHDCRLSQRSRPLVHYDHHDIEFTSFEIAIVPYSGRGVFSRSIILNRKGHILPLPTGGSLTNETDVTFATAWYELELLMRPPSRFVHSSSLHRIFDSPASTERLCLPDIQVSVPVAGSLTTRNGLHDEYAYPVAPFLPLSRLTFDVLAWTFPTSALMRWNVYAYP